MDDRVRGLDAGADDYLAKPFSLLELAARLQALTRGDDRARAAVLSEGDLKLDPVSNQAWRGEAELQLSPKGFRRRTFLGHRRGAHSFGDPGCSWDFGYSRHLDALTRVQYDELST